MSTWSIVAAVSLGLTSLERARGTLEAGATLTEVKPGLWKIGGKEPSSSSCFLAASAGSTPARLLCGDRDRDVTTLGPYLARTLPTLAPSFWMSNAPPRPSAAPALACPVLAVSFCVAARASTFTW